MMVRHLDAEVELQMFMDGKIRPVKIPYVDYATSESTEEILGIIFFHGQNDHQPLEGYTSVSAGDIIRWAGKRYLVLMVGFEEVHDPKFPRTKQELLTKLLEARMIPKPLKGGG